MILFQTSVWKESRDYDNINIKTRHRHEISSHRTLCVCVIIYVPLIINDELKLLRSDETRVSSKRDRSDYLLFLIFILVK